MNLEEAKEILNSIDVIDLRETHDVTEDTYNLAIETVLQELEHLQKENEELKSIDLTTVHIKGVCDEKERWRNKIREKIKMLKKIYELANVESEADYCLRSEINILEDLLE